MANWTQIRDGISQISMQLAEGTTTSADILKNLMPYITAVVDVGMRMETEQTNIGARVLLHKEPLMYSPTGRQRAKPEV